MTNNLFEVMIRNQKKKNESSSILLYVGVFFEMCCILFLIFPFSF